MIQRWCSPEPQLPSHNPHLDQTIFQNYHDDDNKIAFPMPYSHEKESEGYHNDGTASDPVYDSLQKESMTDKEDYNHASASAAVYPPTTEDKTVENDDVEVPESAQVNDNPAVILCDANGEDEDKEHHTYPNEEDTFANKRDTLIGEGEHKEEKVALSDEQANEAQRLEDEKRLKAKMEEETRDRVFQPE